MKQGRLLYKIIPFVIALVGMIGCEPDKVLYEVKPSKAKIVQTSFEKEALFLKWEIKRIPEEKIAAYGISYGEGDRTIEKQFVVSKNTLKTGYRIGKLEEGKKYWAKVRAIYGKFTGAWSETVEGVTGKPLPPKDFTVKKNTKKAKWYVELNWKKNSANEKLKIKWYKWICLNSADGKKAEGETSEYKVNTKDTKKKADRKKILETTAQGSFTCSIRVETDKGVESEVLEKKVTFQDIETPVPSSTRVTWGTEVTFPKSAGHTYTLKRKYAGVKLDFTTSPAKITATQPVSRVVVVAKRAGYVGSAESAEIEFTKKAGNTLAFSEPSYRQQFNTNGNSFTAPATTTDDEGDTQEFVYRIEPSRSGASINENTGEVSIRVAAVGKTFTITASKEQNNKYEAQSANYSLTVERNTGSEGIQTPVLSSKSEPWGTPITFPKEVGHTYTLKRKYAGAVSLEDKGTNMRVTAIQPVSGVVVVAQRDGYEGSEKSDEITFTKQAGTKLSFPSSTETRTTGEGTFTKSTKSYEFSIPAVREIGTRDLRSISYSATKGTINTTGTKFTISVQTIAELREKGETITITATKTENGEYLAQTASYTLTITPLSIGASAFENKELKSVDIPDSVTEIGRGAFRNNKLTSVVIPDSVTKIGEAAFYVNQLTSVVISASVTEIGNAAFMDNQLISVVIPDSVTSIGESAFANNKLTSVTIGTSVTSIGEAAFHGNELKSVDIPASVETIHKGAFDANTELTSVRISRKLHSTYTQAQRENRFGTGVTNWDIY